MNGLSNSNTRKAACLMLAWSSSEATDSHNYRSWTAFARLQSYVLVAMGRLMNKRQPKILEKPKTCLYIIVQINVIFEITLLRTSGIA